jgi:hypothetical protein
MNKAGQSYFGMKQTQIAILGGLAFILMLSLCGFGYLVFSGFSALPSASPPPPIQAVATPTRAFPIITEATLPTLEITITPAVALTAAPPAGWIKFRTASAELWLPDYFVGGDMTVKRSETIQKVAKLGIRFSDVVASMKKEDKSTLLFMVDKNISDTVILEVMVEHIILKEDLPLKDYIDQTYVSEGDLMVIINENKKMTLLGREARRLTYQSRQTSGLEGTVIEYAIKDGLGVWFVAYILPPDQILDLMPMIDQSITTYKIIE